MLYFVVGVLLIGMIGRRLHPNIPTSQLPRRNETPLAVTFDRVSQSLMQSSHGWRGAADPNADPPQLQLEVVVFTSNSIARCDDEQTQWQCDDGCCIPREYLCDGNT